MTLTGWIILSIVAVLVLVAGKGKKNGNYIVKSPDAC